MNKNDIDTSVVLAIGAHPDDLEFGVAGTMAKWIKQGSKGYYLVCTDAGKGSSDPAMTSAKLTEVRRAEQEKAAKVLGLEKVYYFDYEDGFLEPNKDLKRDLVRVIREVKPTVIITWDLNFNYDSPSDFYNNHNDHRATGQATLDAVYPLARDHLSFPELLDEGLQPHRVPTVLLIHSDKPDYFEDITETFDTKLAAFDCHSSQISDSAKLHGIVERIASECGSTAGCQYAESFKRLDLP